MEDKAPNPPPSPPTDEEENDLKDKCTSALLIHCQKYINDNAKKFKDNLGHELVDYVQLADRISEKRFLPRYRKNRDFRADIDARGVNAVLDYPQFLWNWIKYESSNLLDLYYISRINDLSYPKFLFLYLASKRDDGILFPLISKKKDELWIVNKLIHLKNLRKESGRKGHLESIHIETSGHKNLRWLVKNGYFLVQPTNNPDLRWRYVNQEIEIDGVKTRKKSSVTLALKESARRHILFNETSYDLGYDNVDIDIHMDNSLDEYINQDNNTDFLTSDDTYKTIKPISFSEISFGTTRRKISKNTGSVTEDNDDDRGNYISRIVNSGKLEPNFIQNIFDKLTTELWLSEDEAKAAQLITIGEEPDHKPLTAKQTSARVGIHIDRIKELEKEIKKIHKDPTLIKIFKQMLPELD